MSIESYLRVPLPVDHASGDEPASVSRTESPLEDLIHLKSKILGKKLLILAAENPIAQEIALLDSLPFRY